MPNLELEVKARNKEETKLPSLFRHNQMICAINCHQEPTDMKQLCLPYDELELCNVFILKDTDYIDCFCSKFPCHCVFVQVPSDTNLLDNVVLWEKVVGPTKKPRMVLLIDIAVCYLSLCCCVT